MATSYHPRDGASQGRPKTPGSYFIYCFHPERGSITFIIEQDEQLAWYFDRLPPFIDVGLIVWIGATIEEQK